MYFSRHAETGRDADIIQNLILSLKFMRVDDLRTEHLNYATSAVVKLFELSTPAQKTQLKLLLDKIVCHVPNELYRFNMQDDVQMLENFTALF